MELVKVIDDNQEALLWRLRMISSAKDNIVMFTYKMRIDQSGSDVLAALIAAAKRGVKEYILVDSLSSYFHCGKSAGVHYLASFENVQFCFYNPVFFSNPLRITFRLHDKILAVDDEVYMIGGRNVLDISIGNYVKKYNIDRDVVVFHDEQETSASVKQILSYVKAMKQDPAVKEYRASVSEHKREQTDRFFAERLDRLCETFPLITRDLCDNEEDDLAVADEITLISGDPDYRFKGLEIWSSLVRLMEKGEDVLVQTPYIMCNKLMYQGIEEVIKADRSFSIIINAPEAGQNHFGCVDYMNQKKKIRNYGIKIYECSTGQSLHTKSILIDDDISVIGSFNFDMRSAYHDTELMLMIRSRELNAKLRTIAAKHIKASRTTDENGNEIYGENFVKPPFNLKRTVGYAVLRVLVRPFRFLL